MGWDEYRELVFARQKELGIFPAEAELSPRDPDVPEWNSLNDDQKRLYARFMEVFAGFWNIATINLAAFCEPWKRWANWTTP